MTKKKGESIASRGLEIVLIWFAAYQSFLDPPNFNKESSGAGEFHPYALTGRVEDWRGIPRPVSSPRLVKPGVRFSPTGISC